jgi:hypothetical protein
MRIASRAVCAGGVAALLIANSPASAQAVVPYQYEADVADSSTCPYSQCYFTFPTVPRGKRLQLTSVSAQLGRYMNTIVLEGNGVTYFVTTPDPDGSNLTVPVSLFYEPGRTPTARVFTGNGTYSATLVITLVGVLDPA